MRKKEEEEEDDDKNGLTFSVTCFSTTQNSKARSQVFCELLGSIILPACLVWDFVASLAIIRVIHNYGKFKNSVTIPK